MEVVNTVGRRKAAVARVYVKPGKGTITVNHKPMETYFPLDIFQYVVKQPLLVLENPESYDIPPTSRAAVSTGRLRLHVWASHAPSSKSIPSGAV